MELQGWNIDRLLKPYEAADRLKVTYKRLSGWADRGHLVSIITAGGQRRYSAEQIDAVLSGTHRVPRYRPTASKE